MIVLNRRQPVPPRSKKRRLSGDPDSTIDEIYVVVIGKFSAYKSISKSRVPDYAARMKLVYPTFRIYLYEGVL